MISPGRASSRRKEVEVRDAEGSEFRNTGRETIDAFRKEMRLRRRPGEGVAGSLRAQPLEEGTRKLLRFIKRLDCFTLVGGGGTTGRAVETLGIGRDGLSHVSISGGACPRALTGQKLPAIEALER